MPPERVDPNVLFTPSVGNSHEIEMDGRARFVNAPQLDLDPEELGVFVPCAC